MAKRTTARICEIGEQVMIPLVWTDDFVTADDIKYFRGDNGWVWQLKGHNMSIVNYILTTYYIQSIDNLGLLEILKEDGRFGAFTFLIGEKLISRDLLDSITEIYFLEKHLNISSWDNLSVLDIGAGYGRLAHRALCALPNIKAYQCTDAVAQSTFVCDYYLRSCGLGEKAKVVPLHDIEAALENHSVDIAINIHSFSECSISSVDWWMSLIESKSVKYLMVVPNSVDHESGNPLTNAGHDMQKVFEKHGYSLVVKEPKYRDPQVQQYGINPAYHYLFKLSE
jgi:hypothetical protein